MHMRTRIVGCMFGLFLTANQLIGAVWQIGSRNTNKIRSLEHSKLCRKSRILES
jgi:hypothetical protein